MENKEEKLQNISLFNGEIFCQVPFSGKCEGRNSGSARKNGNRLLGRSAPQRFQKEGNELANHCEQENPLSGTGEERKGGKKALRRYENSGEKKGVQKNDGGSGEYDKSPLHLIYVSYKKTFQTWKGNPRKNISKKIDKRDEFDRFLGTPTRRRDEKPGGRRPGKQDWKRLEPATRKRPLKGGAIRRFQGNDCRILRG